MTEKNTNPEAWNPYFYRVWIPLQVLTVISIVAVLMGYVSLNWWVILTTWFLIGPIGCGVGIHRLFCHRQFETYKPIEYTLAILGVFAAYTPLAFFIGNHQFHHRYADRKIDPSSPVQYGFWESFLWWRLRNKALTSISIKGYCFRVFLRDEFLKFVSRNFDKILYAYIIFLSFFGFWAVVNFFVIPVLIEHTRLNLISSMGHMPSVFSYRNFDTKDASQNSLLFGLFSMGFGWHNNHHKNERELVNRHRWWEVDLEGYIAILISKRKVRA